MKNSGPENQKSEPRLFVVATPIGNLSDFSERARRTLAEADLILAEDTREARKLLNLHGINGKACISYHDHVERAKTPELVQRMLAEQLQVALISDAGTPAIADPGYVIISAAHAAGIAVSPIPGPSALLALASASGLPTDRLMFVGFLPEKEKARREEIESWRSFRGTVVFFEALRRAPKSFPVIAETYPNGRLAVGREMTKLYEEIHQLSPLEALDWINNLPTQKGELAVALWIGAVEAEKAQESNDLRDEIREHAAHAFKAGKTLKDLLKHWSKHNIGRSELYQLLLEVKKDTAPDYLED